MCKRHTFFNQKIHSEKYFALNNFNFWKLHNPYCMTNQLMILTLDWLAKPGGWVFAHVTQETTIMGRSCTSWILIIHTTFCSLLAITEYTNYLFSADFIGGFFFHFVRIFKSVHRFLVHVDFWFYGRGMTFFVCKLVRVLIHFCVSAYTTNIYMGWTLEVHIFSIIE